MATTATIKKATVYIAADGTNHPSAKAAAAHVQAEAIKKAVEDQFGDDVLEGYTQGGELAEQQGIDHTETGTPVIYGTGVGKFLLANREKILAVLQTSVEVRQRKPRTPAAKKVATTGGLAVS